MSTQKESRRQPRRENFQRLRPFQLIFIGLALALGVGLPLARGADALVVLGLAVLGVLVGVALLFLPPTLRLVGFLVLVVGGMILLSGYDPLLMIDWFLSAMVGSALGSHLRYLQQRRPA